jgi:hypothetical protein
VKFFFLVGVLPRKSINVRISILQVNVSIESDDGYCLHFDILYEDGTHHYGKSLQFAVGTHDWERSCAIFSPEKPVKSVAVYISVFEHTGTIWFDDLELSTRISQGGNRIRSFSNSC